MSDPATGPANADLSTPTDQSAFDDRLSEILADPTLPDRDKRQAIQDALDELQHRMGDEPAASYEPLETRFFEALSLLAEGGHDYGEAATGGDDTTDEPSPPFERS